MLLQKGSPVAPLQAPPLLPAHLACLPALAADEAHIFHEGWLPSREQQLHFCRAYVAAIQWLTPCRLPAAILAGGAAAAADDGSGGGRCGRCGAAAAAAVTAEAAAQLLQRKAHAHVPLVHLQWGLWGLIQDRVSAVDFEYLAYSRQRIQAYHASKRRLRAPAV
jgi:hypothetical protein